MFLRTARRDRYVQDVSQMTPHRTRDRVNYLVSVFIRNQHIIAIMIDCSNVLLFSFVIISNLIELIVCL